MKVIIELPDDDITKNIIKTADYENGSLFDLVLRKALKKAIIISEKEDEENVE